MTFLKWLKGGQKDKPSVIESNNQENFVDSLIVELKAATSDAITNAINHVEGKYLKTILLDSYFPLTSLTFIPNDVEIAQNLEEFFRVHENINKGFRKEFCKQFLEKEYHSSRGATVKVEDSFLPIFRVDTESLEKNTEDEKFIISLKGKKICFSAYATLGRPEKNPEEKDKESLSSIKSGSTDSRVDVQTRLLISDKDGHRDLKVSLPALIGRYPDASCVQYGIQPIVINSKYVSRHQLFVFSILEDIFYFIPDQASLTCRTMDGEILVRGRNYLLRNVGERLYFGFPVDSTGPISGNVDPAKFPVLEIQYKKREGKPLQTKTPIPTINN